MKRWQLETKSFRQKFAQGKLIDLAEIISRCEVDGEVVSAKFSQDLAASSAWSGWTRGHQGDGSEVALTGGYRCSHGDSLGADGQPEGGVLDVAAEEDRTIFSE